MKNYNVTLSRVVEHETTYRVLASNEEEAINLVLDGNYDEVIEDAELGEVSDPDVNDVKVDVEEI